LVLPLDRHLCAKFKLHADSHSVVQAEELQPWEFHNMVAVALRSTGTLHILYVINVFVAMACVRFEHIQRSGVSKSEPVPVFACSKGKRRVQGARPGFEWTAPCLTHKQLELTAAVIAFWQENVEGVASANFLIPAIQLDASDLFTVTSDTPFVVDKPMSRRQFMEIFKGHLVAAGVAPDKAQLAKYNKLRRFLPTGANVFMFDDSDAQAIGNWTEVPRGGLSDRVRRGHAKNLMAHRYAGNKVLRSRRLKQHVLDLLAKVMKEIWRRKPDVAPHPESRLLAPGSITWELVSETFDSMDLDVVPLDLDVLLAPPEPPSKKPKPSTGLPTEKESDASSSSSSSSSSGDEEAETGGEMRLSFEAADLSTTPWFLQGKKWHMQSALDGECRPIPWCRDQAFSQDAADSGTGVLDKDYENMCRKCFARSPLGLNKALADQFVDLE
jgi:hypothetical protein